MQPPILARIFLLCLITFGIAYASEPAPSSVYEDKQFIIDERASIKRLSAEWADSLNTKNPTRAAALYENHIVVYATYEPKIDNYNDLVEYFTQLVNKENFRMEFNKENIRIFGPTAVNSGFYTFYYVEEGQPKKIPARFSFVYSLTPVGWKIVDHHSSVLPS